MLDGADQRASSRLQITELCASGLAEESLCHLDVALPVRGGRERTLPAAARSESDLQRVPTYVPQPPRYPRWSARNVRSATALQLQCRPIRKQVDKALQLVIVRRA